MSDFRTIGQPSAVSAVRAMLRTGLPHALLLAGPGGVGKTTLALDIAAALLCSADDPLARPCRTCRSCRMVEHGNHPDLHRLSPSGAGGGISIGGRADRGVRDLIADLALLPVEGGLRVALVGAADRMSEDAQSAFLKTLEEPPAQTTIILCADDEERLLPTIRSRCVRIRLGPMGVREVEAVLVGVGVADAPTSARLARITDGRPGHAIAYALVPEAATIRAEIARTLLDLLDAGLTARLTGVRDLAVRAAALVQELEKGAERAAQGGRPEQPGARRARGSRTSSGQPPATSSSLPAPGGPDVAAEAGSAGSHEAVDRPALEEPSARVPAAERRRGALTLVTIWRTILRDLALAGLGAPDAIRNVELLDDLGRAAGRLPDAAAGAFLRELDAAGERLEGNVSPELVLDVLALHWAPATRAA